MQKYYNYYKTYYLKSSSESGPGDLGLSGWEGVGAGEEGRGAANSDMSEASMSWTLNKDLSSSENKNFINYFTVQLPSLWEKDQPF